MKQGKVMVDMGKCIGCGLCGRICPAHNLEIKNKKAGTVLERCILCGQCSAVCPKKAISIAGRENDQIEKPGGCALTPVRCWMRSASAGASAISGKQRCPGR